MIAAVLLSLALAQTPVDDLRARATRDSRALEHARELTDTVGARLAGSPGDARAVAWGVAKMKALGFQNVRAEKVTVPHWERISESAELTSPTRQKLVISALGGTVSTPARGVEAEVVMAADLEVLRALSPDRVKGKIVFLNKKMRREPSGVGYGETVDIRADGMRVAAGKGAAALVIRSVGTSDARFAHTGVLRREPKAREIPAAALAIPDAEQLERLLAGGPVRLRLKLKTKWHPDAQSANVVGEVPGRGALADGLVLIGAHLDSWDLGHGAVDNASGVGAVLEVGRQLLAEDTSAPRRTLRVVLFANEENGGKGGKGYAEAHQAELERHHAALVCDSGAGRPLGLVFHSTDAAGAQLQSLADALGVAAPVKRFLGHPDVRPLMEAGVPLVALQQDASRYFDVHHTEDDTFDKIDPREYAEFVGAVVTVTHHLLSSPEPLPRVPEADRKRPQAH